MILLDTCFVIDLQRELLRREEGEAYQYLKKHSQEEFAISVISLTEFLEGFADPQEGERLLRPFRTLEVTLDVAREAAKIRRQLRLGGQLIGDFDILIGATAITEGMLLVTDNISHFKRLVGLRIESYRTK